MPKAASPSKTGWDVIFTREGGHASVIEHVKTRKEAIEICAAFNIAMRLALSSWSPSAADEKKFFSTKECRGNCRVQNIPMTPGFRKDAQKAKKRR